MKEQKTANMSKNSIKTQTENQTRFEKPSFFILLLCLCLLSAIHFVPHEAGVTSIGAIGILAAAYLSVRTMPLAVMAPVILGNILIGGYDIRAMALVLLAHLLAAFSVVPVLRRIKIGNFFIACFGSAIVFYLVSNIVPMVMGYYPNNTAGWLTCYINGLPYLWRGMLANMVFVGLVLCVIGTFKEMTDANRFTASKRV